MVRHVAAEQVPVDPVPVRAVERLIEQGFEVRAIGAEHLVVEVIDLGRSGFRASRLASVCCCDSHVDINPFLVKTHSQNVASSKGDKIAASSAVKSPCSMAY